MWLKAVFCTNNSIDGSEQIRLLQVQLEASLGCTDRPALSATTQAILANARKRVASDGPSWMGSTTIATRAKKSKLNNGGVGNGLSVIAVDPNEIGHTFLRLDLERALTEPTAAALLRSAVKSRLKFEAWAAGKMAERDLEDRRLLQERADFRMQNVQDKTGENKMKKPIAEITIGKSNDFCTKTCFPSSAYISSDNWRRRHASGNAQCNKYHG